MGAKYLLNGNRTYSFWAISRRAVYILYTFVRKKRKKNARLSFRKYRVFRATRLPKPLSANIPSRTTCRTKNNYRGRVRRIDLFGLTRLPAAEERYSLSLNYKLVWTYEAKEGNWATINFGTLAKKL